MILLIFCCIIFLSIGIYLEMPKEIKHRKLFDILKFYWNKLLLEINGNGSYNVTILCGILILGIINPVISILLGTVWLYIILE